MGVDTFVIKTNIAIGIKFGNIIYLPLLQMSNYLPRFAPRLGVEVEVQQELIVFFFLMDTVAKKVF